MAVESALLLAATELDWYSVYSDLFQSVSLKKHTQMHLEQLSSHITHPSIVVATFSQVSII